MSKEPKTGPPVVQNYRTFLVDKYRPPRKGGNIRACTVTALTLTEQLFRFSLLDRKNGCLPAILLSLNGNGMRPGSIAMS